MNFRLRYLFYRLSLKEKIVLLTAGFATITPILLVAVLASIYYYFGIETLFNDRIQSAVSETVEVAKLYLNENKENIKTTALQIANDIDHNFYDLLENPELFRTFLDKQAELRGLAEIMVFTREKEIARNFLSFSLLFEKSFETSSVFKEVDSGEIKILKTKNEGKVRAIMRLSVFQDNPTYLLVGKYIDKEIINHLKKTQGSAKKYYILLSGIKLTKKKLQITFILLSTFLCGLAVFIATRLAKVIIKPLNHLLEATDKIQYGDYSVRVPEKSSKDEIFILVKAFNKMTTKIEKQRNELIHADRLIDERRKFIETVLSEISAGVIAIDLSYNITLFNNSVTKLLHIKKSDIIGDSISDILPEVKSTILQAYLEPSVLHKNNIIIKRKGRIIHLFVNVGTVMINHKIDSVIITFDDITELMAAQRSAAWSDVARRIAHEIKNPLTPIYLAAERLKKKYAKHFFNADKENFEKYLETIIKYVTNIKFIVAEFVQFARIPVAKIERCDLIIIINEVLFLQKNTYKFIKYTFDTKLKNCYVDCDKAQITQVLNNLLKNSAESIESKLKSNKSLQAKIIVKLTLSKITKDVSVSVIDNGVGIPVNILEKISEPYISSKKEGMGLGLSIVRRILEDHNSKFIILNLDEGSSATFSLKLTG